MRKTVLLVDDNRAIRLFCRAELEAAGYQVVLAHDARQALDWLRQTHSLPHVVVLDVHMPHENGFALARKLNGLYPSLPLILHTSSRHAASLSGAVLKSADVTPLVEAIERNVRDGTSAETRFPH